MCVGSAPSIPAPPPPPPAPTPAPQQPDQGAQQAGADQRKKTLAALGPMQTVTTSPLGLPQNASTTAKTLLGL